MNDLVVPSSRNPLVTLLQFTELTLLVFCCNVQSFGVEGQETTTVANSGLRWMASSVLTGAMRQIESVSR